ncbi:DivIVA domain-containing protein [Lactobacillaceae bacterium Scapto_B20]
MVLSPQDIHNKEFSIKMRGYNIDQVNDFLDQIIKDYQITIKQNDDLRSALNDTQGQLKHFNDLQNSLNQSILVAQQAADQVKDNADNEAKVTIDNANQQAQSILEDANQQSDEKVNNANQHANEIISAATKQVSQLSAEISTLKQSAQMFRNKLSTMLKSQLEFTESEDWDKLLDTSDDKSIEEILHNLDNPQTMSVESNQDSSQLNQTSDQSATVVFYPDGATKQI